MTKVHPNFSATAPPKARLTLSSDTDEQSKPEVLTVWKKSLLFNCDGFTVYNSCGNLGYRVDNYEAANNREIFLMDAAGDSILTIRRKRLSLSDCWSVYDGETAENPLFHVKKTVNLLKNSKCLAQVTASVGRSRKSELVYEIEGSCSQRICCIYDNQRRLVAEIKPKESSVKGVAFGADIFQLVVHPGLIDSAVAMSLVILVVQMFHSSSETSPLHGGVLLLHYTDY